MAPALESFAAGPLMKRDVDQPVSVAAITSPALTSHSLSIMSIVMLAVGAAALGITLIVVTIYAVRIRRAKKRREAFKSKVGEPVLMHAPQHAHNAMDLSDMTPGMRLAQQSYLNDQHLKQRAAAATVAAGQQWQLPDPVQDSARSRKNTMAGMVVPGPESRSSSEHARPSTSSIYRPPLPHDSQFRIQLAHQQSFKSHHSNKSITIVEPQKPSKQQQQQQQQQQQHDGRLNVASSSNGQQQHLSEIMPQHPQAAQLPPLSISSAMSVPRNGAVQYEPQRSLSPFPAASDNGSESYTPILDLGVEFGQDANAVAQLDSQPNSARSDQDPHSWLASTMDSAFNTSDVQRTQSFSKPPRQAPHAPHSVGQGHQRKASKSPRSPVPPPPLGGPPQKYDSPTPGGAARVTVEYASPYQRRTLYGNAGTLAVTNPDVKVEEKERAEDQTAQDSGRTSIEAVLKRTTALFNVLEPMLRASSDQSRPALVRTHVPNADDVPGGMTASSTDASSTQYMLSSNATTVESSSSDHGKYSQDEHVSNEQGHRIPIAAVEQISPMVNDVNTTMFTTTTTPTTMFNVQAVPTVDAVQPPFTSALGLQGVDMQRQENLSNVTLVNDPVSKTGFAASLRAKISLKRQTFGLAASGDSEASSPVWSQKSAAFDASPAVMHRDDGFSPAMSIATKDSGGLAPGSYGPPTMTWNVSTEEVDVPQLFVQPSSAPGSATLPKDSMGSSMEGSFVGLGLRNANNEEVKETMELVLGSPDSVKPLNINKSKSGRTSNSHERKRSSSSRSSIRKSSDRYRSFPWSRTTGPSSSAQGRGSARASEEIVGLNLTQFADAESPVPVATPEENVVEEEPWKLNSSLPSQRDSLASSYCESRCSSLTESATCGAFDYENAQNQRAKLLQSVQKRQAAKGAGQQHFRKKSQGGFTSHSAKLSIDVGSGPLTRKDSKSKRLASQEQEQAGEVGKKQNLLDVNVGQPFLAAGMGDGVLTPPLTPFEKKVPLPSIEQSLTLLYQAPSSEAEVEVEAAQATTNEGNDRLSKLRPLSLAASHPASPRVPTPLQLANRNKRAISRTSSAFGGSATTSAMTSSTSQASLAASSRSSGSASFSSHNHMHSAFSPSRSTLLFQSNVAAHNRTSRLSSTNVVVSGGGVGGMNSAYGLMGPMGGGGGLGLTSPALSMAGSAGSGGGGGGGVLPTLKAGASPSFLPSPGLNSRSAMQQQWLNASTLTTSSPKAASDTGAGAAASTSGTPSLHSARLSGSSFTSNGSLLSKFPAFISMTPTVNEASG